MRITQRELSRHKMIVNAIEEVLYSNPKHIKGLFAYRDKKRLYNLKQKVHEGRKTISFREFQFLDSIVKKYG